MSNDILDNKVLLNTKELAEYWGIKRGTLQQWRVYGTGPLYIKIGGRVMYPRKAILDYAQTRTFRGTAYRITDGGSNEK